MHLLTSIHRYAIIYLRKNKNTYMKKLFFLLVIATTGVVANAQNNVSNTNWVMQKHIAQMFPGHTVEEVMKNKIDSVLSKTNFFFLYPSDGSVYRDFWAKKERDPRPSKYALSKGDLVWVYNGIIFFYPAYENGGAVIKKTSRVTVSGYIQVTGRL